MYGKCSRHIIMQPLIIMKCYSQDIFYGKNNQMQCYILILILLLFVVQSLSRVQLLILYAWHINIQLDSEVKVKSLSHVQLFVTPWTVAYQASLSMGFSRQG